jgi:hypothetical protein
MAADQLKKTDNKRNLTIPLEFNIHIAMIFVCGAIIPVG